MMFNYIFIRLIYNLLSYSLCIHIPGVVIVLVQFRDISRSSEFRGLLIYVHAYTICLLERFQQQIVVIAAFRVPAFDLAGGPRVESSWVLSTSKLVLKYCAR